MAERREVQIGPFTLRYDGNETLDHEVGDEFLWRCPVTGSLLHIERMDDNHFWFRIDVRAFPDGPVVQAMHCGFHQPAEGRLQLLVEEDLP